VRGFSGPRTFCRTRQRLLKQRLGFGVLVHSLVNLGQVIETLRRPGMFRPKNLLPNPEHLLEERFGFGVLVHIPVERGQLVETLRCAGMFWRLLPDPERFLEERLGFGGVPDLFENEPQVIQGIGGLGMLRTPNALCHFNCSFRNGNRLLISSVFNQLV